MLNKFSYLLTRRSTHLDVRWSVVGTVGGDLGLCVLLSVWHIEGLSCNTIYLKVITLSTADPTIAAQGDVYLTESCAIAFKIILDA